MARLEAIRDKHSGRFVIQYDQQNPVATLLPHATLVRTASKLVYLDSQVRLVDGDQAGALRGFELQCRLAGTLGDEPTLISRLVQIAVQAMAVQTAEDMLRVGAVDAAALEEMGEELGAMRQTGTLKWGLLGERAFFAGTCDAVLGGSMSSVDVCSIGGHCNEFPGPYIRMPTFLVRANQLRGTQMLSALLDAVNDPEALMAAARKMEQEVTGLPRTQMFVKMFIPSLTRSITLNSRISAQLDCAIAALAAERFRMDNGRLPTTLEELLPDYLPAVPTDPFDGNPLRLAKTQTGIVIYSVHENGIDDGGDVSAVGKGKSRFLDIGFRLNDLAHRGVRILDDPPAKDD